MSIRFVTLPEASIRATWEGTYEFMGAEDFSAADEITVTVRDPDSESALLTLTKTDGDVTTPSNGVISWRVEQEDMAGLLPKTHDIAIEVLNGTTIRQLLFGRVPIIGWV